GPLTAAVDGHNLYAAVTHLMADGEAHLAIELALFGRQLLPRRAAARRAGRAGELLIARLRVEVPVPVDAVDADPLARVTEVLQVLRVGRVAGSDETLALGEGLRHVDDLALFKSTDGELPLASAFAPRVLEHELVAAVRPLRDDLDRLCAPQSECGL